MSDGVSIQFFLNVRERIVEELESITPEERDEILADLEHRTDDTVLTFDLVEIMENI
jgi:hypothetical protein